MVCLDPFQGRCGTDALLEATGLACPLLDVWPVPNESGVEVGNGIGKVIMASPPVMNNLRPRDSGQPSSDLGCSYELFGINVSTHVQTIPVTSDVYVPPGPIPCSLQVFGCPLHYNTGPNGFSRYGPYPPVGTCTPRRTWTRAVKCYSDATRVSEHRD